MSVLSRLFLVAFLAVFSVGSVMHAGSAASMTIEMAMAESTDAGMADCEACGDQDGESMLACDLHCASAAHAAVPASGGAGMEPVLARTVAWPEDVRLSGLGSPPPGHPPRHIL